MTFAVLRSIDDEGFKSPLDTRPIVFVRHILVKHEGLGARRILTVQANDRDVLDALVRARIAKLSDGWRVVY